MQNKGQLQALIIGAGPAGLTAALELLRTTNIKPVILEASGEIGGISRTAVYRGNRLDIGGHRFFSKSERVLQWWREILPVQGAPAMDDLSLGRDMSSYLDPFGPDPERCDDVMLVRSRVSRILYGRKLYRYPLVLDRQTLRNLGLGRLSGIASSYLRSLAFPIAKEESLEDFFINRFGRRLYLTFFKNYTEKVWGVPCTQISAQWGVQRVKGLSVAKAVLHAVRSMVSGDHSVSQSKTETSLIDRFFYPKFGPGQLWEKVAEMVLARGGVILKHHQVIGLETSGTRVHRVIARNALNGQTEPFTADWFFSSMPVRELIQAISEVPEQVKRVADGLVYRDFFTIGLLVKDLLLNPSTKAQPDCHPISDNWMYIQENDVKLGRLQIFNNWSPYLARNPNTVWLGLEYFCNEGDELWSMDDRLLRQFGVAELVKLQLIRAEDVLDGVVIRQPKAYPAYFGTFGQFDVIRRYTDTLENIFLIGRNGMHRYNNMDHSMLAAMAAVSAVRAASPDKAPVWAVNSEEDYHETAEPGGMD